MAEAVRKGHCQQERAEVSFISKYILQRRHLSFHFFRKALVLPATVVSLRA